MLTAQDPAQREAAIREALACSAASPRDVVRSRILNMAGGSPVSLAALQFAQAAVLKG